MLATEMVDKNDWTREEIEEEISSHTAVTIPVNSRIEAQQRILDLSEMKRILNEAKLIALGECYCRKNTRNAMDPSTSA